MKSRRAVLYVAGLAAMVTCGCVPAVVAAGVVVVGVGAAVLASGCDEAVGVNVWDGSSSHPICDATVVAQKQLKLDDIAGRSRADQQMRREGAVTTFSPCYMGYLGTGTWIVTATRPGSAPATGTVTIAAEHKCNEPIFHSLELTLGTDAAAPEPRMPQPQPGVPMPPPAPTTAPAPPATAPAPPATTTPTSPAPSASVPTVGFPASAPSAPPTAPSPAGPLPQVPAPPTR